MYRKYGKGNEKQGIIEKTNNQVRYPELKEKCYGYKKDSEEEQHTRGKRQNKKESPSLDRQRGFGCERSTERPERQQTPGPTGEK